MLNQNKGFSRKYVLIFFILCIVFMFYKLSDTNSHEVTSNNVNMFKSVRNKLKNLNELPQIAHRDEFGSLLEQLGGYETAIEIGVQHGHFAATLLRKWSSCKVYYGIDPYLFQKNYADVANVNSDSHDKIYKEAKALLESVAGSKVNLIRNFSMSVVDKFADNSIDFIYLDGRHDFCAVSEELNAFYPKLKCNGIMAGHDFYSADEVKGQDWSLCGNGEKVLTMGGAVKGKI